MHLIYYFNLTKYRDGLAEEINKCLNEALRALNDEDNHVIWNWFKQFILDSDVKFFKTKVGLPLFWEFVNYAAKYEKLFQEKFQKKMMFLIFKTKT